MRTSNYVKYLPLKKEVLIFLGGSNLRKIANFNKSHRALIVSTKFRRIQWNSNEFASELARKTTNLMEIPQRNANFPVIFANISTKFCWNFEVWALQKYVLCRYCRSHQQLYDDYWLFQNRRWYSWERASESLPRISQHAELNLEKPWKTIGAFFPRRTLPATSRSTPPRRVPAWFE